MKTGDSKIYTIGEMAKLCNISKKQLRYYDDNHIISPAYKDPKTMYRYYTMEQMQEILLLKELRKMDIPLKDIADILADRTLVLMESKLEQRMEIARKDVEDSWKRYNHLYQMYKNASSAARLLERNETDTASPHHFEIVDLPEQWIVYTRYQSYWNVSRLFTERRAELVSIADKYELPSSEVIHAVFHNGYMKQFSDKEEDKTGDLEIYMNVDNIQECPYCRKTNKVRCVTTVHIGPYPSLISPYKELEIWAKEQGIRLSDTSIEEYTCGTTMTYDESKYVTQIYVLLEGETL